MELVPLSPSSPGPHLADWLRLTRSWYAEEMPGEDEPSEREAAADLASNPAFWRAAVLAVEEGVGVGYGHWEAPLCDNRDLAWVRIYVDPASRGRGIAGVLLGAVRDEIAADGRTRIVGDVRADGVGTSFATAVGARTTAVDVRSLLDVTDIDGADLAGLAVAPEGYQLVQWRDRCPQELVAAFAVARAAMNDAPHGDMTYDDMRWDVPRVRAAEEHWQRFGIPTYVTAAVDETSGAVAGFTEILSYGRPSTVIQDDTGVLRAHRGHGLGLAMKAANLRQVLRHEPQTQRVVTWNAESNTHMRAVNERLGFRMADTWCDLELSLADVHTSSRSLL